MDQQEQSRWRLTRRQVLWAIGIVIALVVLILIGYAYQWTGFGQSEVKEDIQPYKTLWDWLDLLIVPVVLAIGGYLFNSSQNQATQRAAERRAQDDALEAYLDDMSDMLTTKKDQESLSEEHPPSIFSSVARARTLTVLPRLDGDRKAHVVQFLYESELINKDRVIVNLKAANLQGLRSDFDLDLSRINLSGTYLVKADVSGGTDLSEADLSDAYLNGANLSGTNMSGADLRGCLLMEANLSGTNLSGANLSGAFLQSASGVTIEQLKQAFSLEGAIMPDGQSLKSEDNLDGPTFEEWLKSKGHREDGENSAPS